jgi:hypothetical protein
LFGENGEKILKKFYISFRSQRQDLCAEQLRCLERTSVWSQCVVPSYQWQWLLCHLLHPTFFRNRSFSGYSFKNLKSLIQKFEVFRLQLDYK